MVQSTGLLVGRYNKQGLMPVLAQSMAQGSAIISTTFTLSIGVATLNNDDEVMSARADFDMREACAIGDSIVSDLET